ncbi:MAG: transcriptional regulator [Mycobacteriaceae bacterium]
MTALARELQRLGEPLLDEQLRHPTVVGIGRGDLDRAVFSRWLEQDYLYLLDYTRVFSRLAWQAPDEHLGELVDLAHATYREELSLHRELSRPFGADFAAARKSPQCTAYTSFLLDSAAEYGVGLAALLPCMWGYSQLGQRLAQNPPEDEHYRRWVDTYADPAFAALAERCAQMLNEASPEPSLARAAFLTAMQHELNFWDAA